MSPPADDPRREDRVQPFTFVPLPKDEIPFDFYAFLGLWFALGAVLLHVRIYSWLNLLTLLASLSNLSFSNIEVKLILSQAVMTGLTFFSTHSPGSRGLIAPVLASKFRGAVKNVV